MYARAAQNYAPAVYAQAALGVTFQKAYAEALFAHVIAEGNAAGIEVGAVRAPEFCVCKLELKNSLALRLLLLFRNDGFAVENFHFERARRVGVHLYRETGGIIAKRLYFYAAELYMLFGQHVQPYRSVNARARIPTTVGLVGVERLYLYSILPAEVQKPVRLNIEAGVAVGPAARLLAIDIYFCIAVNALELQHHLLALPLFGCGERLFVHIIIPLVPARVFAAGTVRRTVFQNHCVVREGDFLAPVLAYVSVLPAIVEAHFYHIIQTPFSRRRAP